MKIRDAKTGKATVVFNKYELSETDTACPECHRQLKEYDLKRLAEVKNIACSKCGSRLLRK